MEYRQHPGTPGAFAGPTWILVRSDTLLVKDCGRCNRTMFPEGEKKAFAPDTEMMNRPW